MSMIDVNNLLAQMRQMTAQVRMPTPEGAMQAQPASGSPGDFASLLKQGIAAVGNSQMEAGRLAAGYERGDPGADLGRTMVALQKADLSLRTAVAVQSKLVSAYQDIMNMTF